MDRVRVNGLRIAFRRTGSGPPLQAPEQWNRAVIDFLHDHP